MIVGLVGPSCAGKQSVIDVLTKELNFLSTSLSDSIREECRREGMEETRDNLIATGNRLRKEQGHGVLAKLAARKMLAQWRENWVVDSIRHPEEVRQLKQRPGFVLLAIDAPLLTRYRRSLARGRARDSEETFEQFVEHDDGEVYGLSGGAGQSIRESMAQADHLVLNVADEAELGRRVLAIPEIAQGVVRPAWDSYFMSMARLAARRTNCMKRCVGAVLVKNNRVIATGYNGTPRGCVNCNEGGCPRCNNGEVRQGQALNECLCLHAEENAIIEAGKERAEDCTLFSTLCPCLQCAKRIVQAGIKRVVYSETYAVDVASRKLLQQAKIDLFHLE